MATNMNNQKVKIINMVNAQQYLDQNYPKEKRINVTELSIKKENLEGHLDLTDFENLQVLDCSINRLTSIDLSNCKSLQSVSCHDNQLTSIDFLKKLPNPDNVTYLNTTFPITLCESKLLANKEFIDIVIKIKVSWNSLQKLTSLRKEKKISSDSAFLEILKMLKAEREQTNRKTAQLEEQTQEYTIFDAAEENEVEIIQELIENKVNINGTDEQGNAALHFSVMKGRLEVTRKLLELGAKVDIKNEDGETPLHLAMKLEEGATKISTILLEKGASPNVKDELGNTALHYAAQNGNLELLKILFEHEGDINATNNFNWSVLHSAASAIVEGIEN